MYVDTPILVPEVLLALTVQYFLFLAIDLVVLSLMQDRQNYPSMIAQACDLLLKYVINLLKPRRPQVWRSIKTTNSHFCARVDCMVGARDILIQIGYSETQSPSAMQFPEHVKEPNKEKLHIIAAELLMAKLEAESLANSPISRQSSTSSTGSQQASNPGTPNSSQLLQQQASQGAHHNGHHMVPTMSHASHVTPPASMVPMGADPLQQPHPYIQPTRPLNYEMPASNRTSSTPQ